MRPLLLVATTLALSAAAHAQTPSRRALIDRGISARDAGDHAAALDLFLRAGALQMRPGLRMSIAQEQHALGRARDACESATLCVAEVQSDLGSAESGRVMQGCGALVTATCAALGRVRVVVPASSPETLRVRLAGRDLDLARGATFTAAVEPGEALVESSSAEHGAFSRRVSVGRGAVTEVVVSLERAPPPAPSPVPDPSPAPAPAPPRVVVANPTPHPPAPIAPTPGASITGQWWFWTGLSVIVVGGALAGMAAGGVFDRDGAPLGGTAYTVRALSLP